MMATRNRRDELLGTLGRLRELPERPPVVVVDNGSSDGTAAAVAVHYPEMQVVALPANVGAAARTVGVRRASTPFVALSDDDSWWEPSALARAAGALHDDPRIGLLAAHILVGPEERDDPTSVLMAAGDGAEEPGSATPGRRAVTGFLACAAVVRRSAFLGVGGFEPHLVIGGEEELVALDLAEAGWKLIYAPEVVAHHYPSPRRDVSRRRLMLVRNRLLTSWLRYSVPVALRRSAAAVRSGDGRFTACLGTAAAVRSAPWTLAHRAAVATAVEDAFVQTRGGGCFPPPPSGGNTKRPGPQRIGFPPVTAMRAPDM